MSYSLIDDSQFDITQKQLIAKARSEPGIHIIDTGGTELCRHKKTFSRLFPKTIVDGVTLTAVFRYEHGTQWTRYRVEDPANATTYIEFFGATNAAYSVVINGTTKETQPCSGTFYTGTHVLHFKGVNGLIECALDGKQDWTYLTKTAVTSIRKHCMNDALETGCPYLIEHHQTYSADAAVKVFPHGSEMAKPEATLSPGGLVVWEGDASGQVTVKYNNITLFNRAINKQNIRITMEVFLLYILIGVDDEEPVKKDNPKAGLNTNPMYSLTISKDIKLKNFILQTGSRVSTYF
ncbi:uncharacterized protein LOC135388718 isoform X1 [Ornithodoros turicata]|uniref:uncharacterized protein LOC135388718 isoform X1 n=1 Tax=Ornithodoros turicata TaxID=34597 RepID=UPI0031397045